jgi:glutaredoxin-related protein
LQHEPAADHDLHDVLVRLLPARQACCATEEFAVHGDRRGERPELREEMISRSQRRTVPQIFIGARHIGGCDELLSSSAAANWIG